MNWVRKKSLPTIESISYENQLCNTLPELWHALYLLYNSVENRPINTTFLSELPQVDLIEWPPFSKQEFRDALAKCSASSAPGCKGTPPFPPLNTMTPLQSYLSLFTNDT